MSKSVQLILTATSTLKNAREIARLLLEESAAACVSILPDCESHYEWRGKKMRAREYQLLIKARLGSFRRIKSLILKAHIYDLPEILCLSADEGHEPYVKWIWDQTAGKK